MIKGGRKVRLFTIAKVMEPSVKSLKEGVEQENKGEMQP